MRRYVGLLAALLCIAFAPSANAQIGDEPFVGEIMVVPYNFSPNGWAFCDGSLLPISQHTALFSLIGTYYGGDGVTTFALPDLRGRTAIHAGQGNGLSPYVIGQAGGVESVTLTINQIPAHTHQASGTSDLGASKSPAGNIWASQSILDLYSSSGPFVQMAVGALGTAGGSQPHDNMSPYLVLNYVIALQGIYPSMN